MNNSYRSKSKTLKKSRERSRSLSWEKKRAPDKIYKLIVVGVPLEFNHFDVINEILKKTGVKCGMYEWQ